MNMLLLATCRATIRPLAVLTVLCASSALASAQTTSPAPAAAKPADPTQPAKPKVEKSVRLDKHAAPWTVIWHTRLWTDVPEAQEFVKATHPDPKSLKYEPLIGKDPERPKPRDAAGIAALQAELEGDLAHNVVRGKAINDISPPAAAAAKPAKKAASKSGRARKTAKAASTTPKVD